MIRFDIQVFMGICGHPWISKDFLGFHAVPWTTCGRPYGGSIGDNGKILVLGSEGSGGPFLLYIVLKE